MATLTTTIGEGVIYGPIHVTEGPLGEQVWVEVNCTGTSRATLSMSRDEARFLVRHLKEILESRACLAKLENGLPCVGPDGHEGAHLTR